jgi:PHP family Zn ribbon phosphoesterase
LLDVSREEMISKKIDEKLIELILKNRDGKIKVKPGFDGEYGKIIIEEEQKKLF